MSPIPRSVPRHDLAFCFPCQPLGSFAWDASAAAGHPEVDAMFAQAAARLADRSLAAPTRLQVVTYTSAVAYASLLMDRGAVPVACMPHSMGLYAALVTAGACDFEPMLEYVIEAGQAIHESSQAGDFEMASVFGIASQLVEEICRWVQGAHVANYNATTHTVVSGHRRAVEEVCRIALERDAYDVQPLGTGVALHTPIMEPVSLFLATKLEGFPVRAPQTIVLCPFRAVPLEKDEIVPTLSRHISRPVRFEQLVNQVAAAGVTQILEVGYEKLLSKFVGWTNPDIAARSVGTAASLDREARCLRQ